MKIRTKLHKSPENTDTPPHFFSPSEEAFPKGGPGLDLSVLFPFHRANGQKEQIRSG